MREGIKWIGFRSVTRFHKLWAPTANAEKTQQMQK